MYRVYLIYIIYICIFLSSTCWSLPLTSFCEQKRSPGLFAVFFISVLLFYYFRSTLLLATSRKQPTCPKYSPS